MKNTMVGMLPSGTYVLARLDGTPYSQGEYEMLLRDFDVLQESRAFWESEHTREREQRQKEIGAQEFRGNTVSYIYDKEKSYGAHFDRMRGEIAALTAALEADRATVASQAKRLEELEADHKRLFWAFDHPMQFADAMDECVWGPRVAENVDQARVRIDAKMKA